MCQQIRTPLTKAHALFQPQNSTTLHGLQDPKPFLHHSPKPPPEQHNGFELLDPENYVEVKTFSKWKSLTSAMAKLQHIAHCFACPEEDGDCTGWHICEKAISCNMLKEAQKLIIKKVQHEAYAEEFSCITAKRHLSHCSPVAEWVDALIIQALNQKKQILSSYLAVTTSQYCLCGTTMRGCGTKADTLLRVPSERAACG